MAPSCRSGNNDNNNNENPDIAAIIAQQLQTILLQVVTQVTNNVNNANNGNRRKWKWSEQRMHFQGILSFVIPRSMMERVFHELDKLVSHLVTPESSRIKRYIAGLTPEVRGMLRATQPTTIHNAILRAGILTGEAIQLWNLTKKLGHFARDYRAPVRQVAPVNAVRMSNNSRVCYECIVNPGYVIEVADGKKVEVDRIIRECKLELESSLFSINLIALGHGSFDMIVEWIVFPHKAVIALKSAKEDEPKLSDIYVVREFEDVFAEDLREKLYAHVLQCESGCKSAALLGHVKNQKYVWGVEQEEAFQTLKNNLCNAPILMLPDGVEDFIAGMREKIQVSQSEALKQENILMENLHGLDQQMEKKEGESLYFNRPYIGSISRSREPIIMDEAYILSTLCILEADKMYYDLSDYDIGAVIKRDIANLMSKSGHDTIWVIVDRLTKSAHFLAIREDYSTKRLAKICIDEIVTRHGVPVSIISDIDG
ncbi:putative reverse transcriptase domain-containing protein [Tanacetum coccineum]